MEVTERQTAKIAEWLALYHPPGDALEGRALFATSKKPTCATFADVAAAAAWATAMNGRETRGVYFTLNPIRPEMVGTRASATKADIVRRRWLPVDVDPVRPANTNATNGEKAAAWAQAHLVREILEGIGLRGLILSDSGNGWHPCYPLDLPADDASERLVQETLQHLAGIADTAEAKVDTSVFDACRIWKVPGTLVRKGTATEERPHRWARVIEGVAWDETTARANNDLLAAQLERWRYAASMRVQFRPEPLSVEARAIAYLAKCPPAIQGQKGSVALLNAARGVVYGFDLGQEVGYQLLDAHYNPRCQPPWSEKELRHKCKEADTKPFDKARGWLLDEWMTKYAPEPSANGVHKPAEPATEKPAANTGPVIIRASSIPPRKVEWLWPGRLPIGKLTTFAGVGGLGKTFVLCDITARITKGIPWPDAPDECPEVGQVLFISGEDDPEDTLVPRLIEMGADLNRVCFLKTEVLGTFTLGDLKLLGQAAEQMGPGLRFVAIDPPTAFLAGVDDHKNAELRRLLSPLATWSSARRVVTAFNTHVSKPQGKVEAMMRVMGSVAWVNAVRAAHMFARDPNDLTQRLFCPMKNNLGAERKALAYRIVPTETLARVEWLGEVDTTADEAVAKESQPRDRSEDAADFLSRLFVGKIEIASDIIWAEAKRAKISVNAVKEAKQILKIRAALRAVAGQQFWVWIWTDMANRPRDTSEIAEQGDHF